MNAQTLHPKTITRELLNWNLNLARLPITAIDRISNRGGEPGGSPVSMAFDGADAGVKEFLGRFLGDTPLLDDARLLRAKLAQLRIAVEQQATAELEHAQAEARFQAKQEQVEAKRQRVEQDAKQREQQLEREKAKAKQQVEQEAARKQEAADKAAAARQERLAADERAAELRRLEADAAALAEKERALAAEETVTRIDAAAKETKKARKSA